MEAMAGLRDGHGSYVWFCGWLRNPLRHHFKLMKPQRSLVFRGESSETMVGFRPSTVFQDLSGFLGGFRPSTVFQDLSGFLGGFRPSTVFQDLSY